MSIQALRDQLPEYAKDLKLNLGNLIAETTLTDQQKYGVLVGSAIASRNNAVIEAISAEATSRLSTAAYNAAKAAAAIMGMNNIYYRFTHLVDNPEFQKLPAKLRMNVIANPGVERVDFELWSLAVSAINGCGACVTAHEKVVRQHGLTAEQVQAAVRIAAVVHAVAVTLETETSTAQEPQVLAA